MNAPVNQQPTSLNPNKSNDLDRILTHKHNAHCCESCCLCVGQACYFIPWVYLKGFITLSTYQRAVIYRLGVLKSKKPEGPGLIRFNPILDKLKIVDIRENTFDMPAQNLLTKDTLMCTVDAVVYYKVTDVVRAQVNVEDVHVAVRTLALTQLRTSLSRFTLADIIAEKDTLAKELGVELNKATVFWGVAVNRIDIKNIALPRLLTKAMAVEAQAARDAKAIKLASEGEKRSAPDLKEAAQMMAGNPTAMQLRYLQTMTAIGAKNNHTIAVPIDADLLQEVESSGFKNLKFNWENLA